MERTISPPRRDSALINRAVARAAEPERPKRDLLVTDFPFEPGHWNIVVEPLEPKTRTEGGIEVVSESIDAEKIQITIGRVLKAGPTAMEGRTSSGILLCEFTDKIKTREQLIGSYVMFQRYTGATLVLREDMRRLLVMNVTELLGITTDPNAWKFYL